ncbi:acyl CoA:acetate/3-ketoacid CoA transferase [Histidinibacterium aquaticum]|uniref:Acetate CoA-transferase YdiF n=1 Tax=Histidinibacterium aquaticum TaxID=2613962 RepID=A0A5J5GRA1_9RHOB|nr:CoA-transferase [Histidinibacterium aquaticum]KAA9010034.1 acyl CoA:acetate/3-ketoacid CoA transferase [Histidinibacterium aquaticum]
MKTVNNAALRDLVSNLPDGATVAISGAGGGLLEPDEAFKAFEDAFHDAGRPRGLTLVHALGMGDRKEKGVNRFAYEGMVRRVIGGHWVWSPRMLDLAQRDRIEAYCLPSGVLTHLFREIGAKRPGLFTHVGLGTFCDPRLQGGRCNTAAQEPIVELMEIDGKDVLRYLPFKVDVAVIRGTAVDANGNITARDEPADLDSYAIALAAKASGGIVIAQVRDQVEVGDIRPREVTVPGKLVDYVLPAPEQTQTYHGPYSPALAGLSDGSEQFQTMPEHHLVRRIVAERAAQELVPGATINFGFGMSAGVAEIVARRGERSNYWFTIEQGIHGGQLLTGDLFGIAAHPAAILSSAQQFDLYSGGLLDQTYLGLAEMDAHGSVNVSHFGGQVSGPGGFIDISQGAQRIVFCGSFDAKGARVSVENDKLRIDRHGEVQKLVPEVGGVTFSGAEAIRRGQRVTYITERAVFELTPEGVELTELAPGIDLKADVLDRMGFTPIVHDPVRMEVELFRDIAEKAA